MAATPIAAPHRVVERSATDAQQPGRRDGARSTLCPRHLFGRHVLLRSAAHPRGRRHPAFSNTPTDGNLRSPSDGRAEENTIIDMGDDEFTQGRPHPMIDPTLRDARIREEDAADPTTAVVLFDVVLGYGSSRRSGCRTPRSRRLQPRRRRRRRAAKWRSSAMSAAPTRIRRTGARSWRALKSAGVLVASSNAKAAALVRRDHCRAPRSATKMKTLFRARPQSRQRRPAGLCRPISPPPAARSRT